MGGIARALTSVPEMNSPTTLFVVACRRLSKVLQMAAEIDYFEAAHPCSTPGDARNGTETHGHTGIRRNTGIFPGIFGLVPCS